MMFRMTITTICCPRCKSKGSVLYQAATTEPACATRCPLCWGLGRIPVLEVLLEDRNALALHYWLCNCADKRHRIHPSNHDVCPICDLTDERADLAPAEDVQAFFQESFRVRLEFVGIA